MKKPVKSKLLKKMAKALQQLSTGTQPQNSEGGISSPPVSRDDKIQRVDAPLITTSTNPTAPRVLNAKPRTHQRTTRANTPGKVPDIVHEESTQQPVKWQSKRLNPHLEVEPVMIKSVKPNFSRIPFASPNMISQEAVNLLTTRSYYEDQRPWTPETDTFITSSPTSNDNKSARYDADIEHFCAPIVHPVTGETISSYK